MTDAPQIKALLQARIGDLVNDLAPDGARNGRYWIARNPTRNDDKPGSFWIVLHGGAGGPGVWADEATGDKGDVIGLIQYIKGFTGPRETFSWARGWLGLADMPPELVARQAKKAARNTQQIEREAAASAERSRKGAFALWLNCWDDLTGTAGETYLTGRGIDLSALPRPPRAIRFAPNMEHIGEGNVRTRWPCLVALMTGADGKPRAVHRTWLTEDGSGKAPVTPARKIWPSFRGAVIQIARGETGLPVRQAAEKGMGDRLALVEGIEDGLAVALARPGLRVWAAASLANLASVTIPPCAREVIVCADNDWGKPQAEAMLNKGLAALARQGVPVLVARSAIGKDMNDALRGSMQGAA